MSDYVCKIEETVDRLVDQKVRECRFSLAKKLSVIRRAWSGENLSYILEAGEDYADELLSDLTEKIVRPSGAFIKVDLVILCVRREKYLSDRTNRQLRESLFDGELLERLKKRGEIIGMKSLFGISTREEYLEWIEGERELDFHCI